MKYIYPLIRLTVAIILLQTLFYKFTAHPDSVYIFDKVGLGNNGRLGIGILELIAAILLLIPRTVWIGAIIAMGVMSGAIVSHLTILGKEVNEDGGLLFYLAVVVLVGSLFSLVAYRKHIPYQNI